MRNLNAKSGTQQRGWHQLTYIHRFFVNTTHLYLEEGVGDGETLSGSFFFPLDRPAVLVSANFLLDRTAITTTESLETFFSAGPATYTMVLLSVVLLPTASVTQGQLCSSRIEHFGSGLFLGLHSVLSWPRGWSAAPSHSFPWARNHPSACAPVVYLLATSEPLSSHLSTRLTTRATWCLWSGDLTVFYLIITPKHHSTDWCWLSDGPKKAF